MTTYCPKSWCNHTLSYTKTIWTLAEIMGFLVSLVYYKSGLTWVIKAIHLTFGNDSLSTQSIQCTVYSLLSNWWGLLFLPDLLPHHLAKSLEDGRMSHINVTKQNRYTVVDKIFKVTLKNVLKKRREKQQNIYSIKRNQRCVKEKIKSMIPP